MAIITSTQLVYPSAYFSKHQSSARNHKFSSKNIQSQEIIKKPF